MKATTAVISPQGIIKNILIPRGAFIMGTDIEAFYGTALANSEHAKLDEAPMHVRFLEAYLIEQYPVTNTEYAAFVQATNHPAPPHWKNATFSPEEANLPVVHVSWHDSNAYAQWAGKRLPTEAEWEKACRGPDGRIYPWGNIFVSDESESTETPAETLQILTAHLTPVGVRPATISPYGVGDAAGNVWEWTADWYQPYSNPKPLKQGIDDKHKAMRGGSWLEVRDGTAERYFRCANRLHAPPDYAAGNIGFRCVREVLPGQVESVHVPADPLADYVKERKLSNLHLLQKRAQKNSLKDTFIAVLLIGGAIYGIVEKPELVLGAVTAGIIGVGFLFSASVNFWRRWRAVARAKQVESDF
ncbi:formylglycine-generating enzyme family protein [Candidatus Poribacteria bacterium]|nr:formylglycine-generating enzyme family protein [Candidatus Poribacteria bacterium]